jgi:hypothetical protein
VAPEEVFLASCHSTICCTFIVQPEYSVHTDSIVKQPT